MFVARVARSLDDIAPRLPIDIWLNDLLPYFSLTGGAHAILTSSPDPDGVSADPILPFWSSGSAREACLTMIKAPHPHSASRPRAKALQVASKSFSLDSD